jgi:hypothetical protein
MADQAGQSNGLRSVAWWVGPAKRWYALRCMAGRARESVGVHCIAGQTGPVGVFTVMLQSVLIFILAGSLGGGGKEAWGEDPNQERSYFAHTICSQGLYSNQARSELPTGFVT